MPTLRQLWLWSLPIVAWLFLLVSLSVLGGVAGYLTGNSRDPAVGAVVPAMLTFVGGLATYLAFQKVDIHHVALLAACTLVIALSFFIGTQQGAENRAQYDDPERQFERLAAEEQNRFRLNVMRLQNEALIKKLTGSQ